MDFSNKIEVNLEKIGVETGVPERQVFSPDGKDTKFVQVWDKESALKALAAIKSLNIPLNAQVLLTGPVEQWLIVAAIECLRPRTILTDYPFMGVEELVELKTGTADSAIDARFDIREAGDNVFVNFDCDEPDAMHHTFNPRDVPKITVQEIPENKNVFFFGRGMVPAMIPVANAYVQTCRSLFMAAHDDEYYTCAYSAVPEFEMGDRYPR